MTKAGLPAWTDDDVIKSRVIFADFDRGLPGEWHVEPHLVVHTSTVPEKVKGEDGVAVATGRMIDKYQVYWLCSDAPTEKKAYTAACERIIAQYGSDAAVKNIGRVMRLPGSLHQKDPTCPQLVTFEDRGAGVAHVVGATFTQLIDGLPEGRRRKERQQATGEAGGEAPHETEEEPKSRDYLAKYVLAGINPVRPYAEFQEILWGFNNTPIIPTPGIDMREWKRVAGQSFINGLLLPAESEFEPPSDALHRGEDEIDRLMDHDPRGPDERRFGFGTLVHYYRLDNDRDPLPQRQWELARRAAKEQREAAAIGSADANTEEAKAAKLRERFRVILPSEAMRRPPPKYWDKEKLFIRGKGGSLNLAYAAYSNFKTTWCLGHALATAKATGCRILYIVGEGADGFGPKTVAAAQKDWNDHHLDDLMTDEWLDAHLHLVGSAPFLKSDKEIEAVVKQHQAWQPNIVFLDTLGSAVPGQNISEPETGTLIGAVMRELCHTLRADCWLVHHSGKDASRGPLGTIYFVNDPDMVLALKHDTAHNRLTVSVEKDRWGGKLRQEIFGTRVVYGLSEYGEDGKVARSDGQFVAVYELAEADYRRHTEDLEAKRQANEQRQRDESLKWRVIGALAAGTETEQDHMAGDQLAMRVAPIEAGEDPEQWQARIKDTAWLLGQLTNQPEPQGRKRREGYTMGLLADFSRRTELGGQFKPARFYLPDTWRELAKQRDQIGA